MKSNVYSVYDKVAKCYRALFYYGTDEDCIRRQLYSILMDYPLRDIEIHQLGEFDDENGILSSLDKPRDIDLSSYKFPKSTLSDEDLSLKEIDEHAKKSKAEFISSLKENNNLEVQNEQVRK